MRLINRYTTTLVASAIVLTATSFVSLAKAESSVWKASKGGNHFFLGGTVHVLTAEDYPLPCEYDLAYSASDKLYFETDINPNKQIAVAANFFKQGTYPFGEDLNSKLSKQTLSELNNYLQSLGLPAAGFMKYKPGTLLTLITVTELNKLGAKTEGVDIFYYNLAQRDNKPTGYFEELEEQISFIANMGVGNEESFIKYTIENNKDLENQYSGMRKAWRNGDIEKLADVGKLNDLRENFPNVFATLLTNRNEQWLTRIDSLIQSPEVEYVLVGALHMADKEGLLARLKTKGYKVNQLSCP